MLAIKTASRATSCRTALNTAASSSAAGRRLTSSLAPSSVYTAPSAADAAGSSDAVRQTPTLTPADRQRLTQMLRVDHAGEVAANTIYQAQAAVFGRLGDQKTEQLMLEMWETEKKHLHVVEKLLAQHRVTPSKLMPVWSAAGSLLGGVTALLGKEAAMACTEAVETVIGEHYDDQLVHLQGLTDPSQSTSPAATAQASVATEETTHPSLPLLREIITEFRDDELEHLDTAVEHDAQQAPAHALLSVIVGWGCKGAIAVAGRV